MIHEIRVIFGDTDQMGVVYYANYLRFFEGARAGYWRGCGRTHKDLDNWGVALPVVEAHARYRKPAFYEDLLAIEGMDKELAYELAARGIRTRDELADQSLDELEAVPGLDPVRAGQLIMAARAHLFESAGQA